MKKLLLTLIVALGLCGSTFAQAPYESNWPNFNGNMYPDQAAFVAAIMIDGEIVTAEYEGWDAFEVAFFVGDECRGAGATFPGECHPEAYYLYNGYVEDYGDPFPILDGTAVYYENSGETVTIKIYDHLNGILYENFEVLYNGEPIEILTGEDHMEGWDDPENPIFLSITTGSTPAQTFTKDIAGYGEGEGNWYFIASPIGTANPTEVENMIDADGNYDLYAFDQTQLYEEWQNYKSTNFLLEQGKGYLYASQEDVTLTFTGIPVEGNEITLDLVYDANMPLAGWNLVGNPFTVDAYIGKEYYTLNDGGTEVMTEFSTAAIAPMEGAFVIAEEDGETLTISTEPVNVVAGALALNLSQNRGVIDRTIVNFGKGNLPKFQLNPNHTKVYIPMEGKDFAVVSSEGVGEMPVNFKAEKNGIYTLSLSTKEVNFAYLHLIDNMTGNDVNLLETPSYSFNAKTTDYASRFRLVFATSTSVDGDSFGFINGMGNLCIFGIDGEATVQVIDVLGHVLSSETFSGSYETKLNVAPGTYMFRLIQGSDVKVQKMVIK